MVDARRATPATRIKTVGSSLHRFSALIARAFRLNERLCIDCFLVSSRRSLELSVLLNRQCSMENIALNDTGAT
jgi:hypothetical protein